MPYSFTRLQLYDLVWSEPMRSLAGKYNISDRGLAKACAAANIPVPAPGYWNKFRAAKKVLKRPLPPRGFGMSENIIVGGDRWRYYNSPKVDHLNDSIPPPPVFEVEMDVVRIQVESMVNKAPLPKSLTKPHRLIAKLLSEDEERRQKSQASPYPSSWDAPIFDTSFERRRLKILNGLFTCLEHCAMKPSVHGKIARDLSVTVGDQHVSFTLDSASAEKQLAREKAGYSFLARGNNDKMCLTYSNWRHKDKSLSWLDEDNDPLEDHLRTIVIELIVAGEESYRQGQINHRKWLVESKAAAEEEECKRKIEEERKRRERQKSLEQARIDHLLSQARALHQATQIRTYVATVQKANASALQPMTGDELALWTTWALTQADRIDPVISGLYRTRPQETEE